MTKYYLYEYRLSKEIWVRDYIRQQEKHIWSSNPSPGDPKNWQKWENSTIKKERSDFRGGCKITRINRAHIFEYIL